MNKLLLCSAAALSLIACGKKAASPEAEAARGESSASPAAESKPAADALVRIDGSSTVFPIAEALAEEFQKSSGVRVTVGMSGTGGGFKKFCRGEIDIANASRPIKSEEAEACAAAGVEYIELPIALDALAVIVNPANNFVDCLSVDELKALWRPEEQGKATTWREVRADWPDDEVALFGAGTDSGTFDYFTKAVNGEEGASRGDYTATEDDNVTIAGVSGDKNALGYLGLAYAAENAGKVKTVPIRQAGGSCVAPSAETARNATYQPLSRPLFVYVNKAFADSRAELRDFIAFSFAPDESATLVGEVGYVALPAEAYKLAEGKFDARKTGSYFGGGSKVGVTIEELLSDAAATP